MKKKKTCKECHQEKYLLTDFYVKKNFADGRDSICKVCRRIKLKAWQAKNRLKKEKESFADEYIFC